jgi:transglutaminase-like putative cysteine protease
VIYDVSHRTSYRYSIPVSFSHHVLHLSPRPFTHQTCHRTALSISPTPTVQASTTDYFGNPVTHITLQEQHRELSLHARSVIEVHHTSRPAPSETRPWDEIYRMLETDVSEDALESLQYVFDSPRTRSTVDLRDYAAASFPPGRPVLEGALDLTRRIFEDFDYDDTATTVWTPVDEVFAGRRGVCQDFAHLELACLRALRLPARYVSGYLLTKAPEGKSKLVGADASHAWISVWCPGYGWVDLDPTNNLMVSVDHVAISIGRDYGDVSPVNGVIFGGGAHTVDVAVDVNPVEAVASD